MVAREVKAYAGRQSTTCSGRTQGMDRRGGPTGDGLIKPPLMQGVVAEFFLTDRPVVSEYRRGLPAFALCLVEPDHSFGR